VTTNSDASASLAFKGLRVFDASQGLAGPQCAMLLAQHGAEVIKLEPPEGDWGRGVGKRYGDHSALAMASNRGKRSIVLDMKRPGAQQVAARIAQHCDVVLESFRPGVAERIGLGYETLRASNPGLIYLSISGYGQQGPYAERPGTDTVIQAFSAMMSFNRDAAGQPNKIGFLVVDTLTALYAFQAVSAALYARLAGGPGKRLDVSLMQASAAFLGLKVIEATLEGDNPKALNAPAGVYRTSDGWISVTLSKEIHYAGLCKALDRPDLRDNPRYASFELRADNQAELAAEIGKVLARDSSANWISRIEQAGALASPVNTMTEWLADPHVTATAGASWVDLAGVGQIAVPRIPGIEPPGLADSRGHFPGVGTEGPEVLRSFGFSESEITALRDSSVLVAKDC
jgi:crotonobetainyl-CoA:carnitine CoA-transferase CaiB-like acyl-CoA transferase